jgi:RNA polymerase sigma-70 factor (ECF subfamily)
MGDPDVLEGVRRRDPEALGRIFDAAFPFVYALAVRFLGDRSLAEDAAQDVFAKVHRAADRVDPARHLKPWLTTITLNTCRDRLRRRNRRPELAMDPGVLETVGHKTESPEYQLIEGERKRLLERAMESLDEKHREVVVLHIYAGQPHEDSAQQLGITPAAARKRYSRALKKLREFMDRNRID